MIINYENNLPDLSLTMFSGELPEIIHVHIPKTGGKWLDDVMHQIIPDYYPFIGLHQAIGIATYDGIQNWRPPLSYYVDEQEVNFHIGPGERVVHPNRFKRATKISICRNPYDLLTSYYFHDSRDGGLDEKSHYVPEYMGYSGPPGWDSINVMHGIRSFDGFIKRYCDPTFRWYHSLRQKNLFVQMYGDSGECEVDFIIRQERLFEGVKTFLTMAGYCQEKALDPYKGKINISKRKKKDYRHYYTDELRELVAMKCARELNDFGYDFDGPTDTSAFIDPGTISNYRPEHHERAWS